MADTEAGQISGGDIIMNDLPAGLVMASPKTTETPIFDLIAEAAQAIRDSNGWPEALNWWKVHPQIVPADIYARAALEAAAPAIRRAALIEAIDACAGEYLTENTGATDDAAYNQGVTDARLAILSLLEATA